jgi:alpha-L-arabinofuranosidase
MLPALLLCLAGGQSGATASITVRADRQIATVSPELYGVFFEEINQAGEGGIYAELIRNRGLEDAAAPKLPSGWGVLNEGGPGQVVVDTAAPLNQARRHSIRIEREAGDGRLGVFNEGFWGIPLRKGARYRLTLWAKGDSPLDVALGRTRSIASAKVAAPGSSWKRIEQVLTASADATDARLSIVPTAPGTTWIAYASVMPVSTWKGRANGLRQDLAEHVAGMKPAFVRFPGGCYVEGQNLAQAWDWKSTLGAPEERPGSPKRFWGYSSSDGLGYHEYLQWCEDLGASALFVANCGLSHTQTEPMESMDRWVQNTLDAIEYANGPATSKWGSLRARNGHPKPFNLKYVEIGNENGYSWAHGGLAAYSPRYRVIYDAIKKAYPEILTIADVALPHPMEILDEHYYETPQWFWRNANRYDNYSRKGPKIYVGEYAVTRGSGTGNLAAALGEAAFMTGMERNSDVVLMSSYAPLFVNINNKQWNPDAIVFDANRSYGTPSYHVQAMFGQNRPDVVVETSATAEAAPAPPIGGTVGVLTWRTDAEFKEIEVVSGGRSLYSSKGISAAGIDPLAGQWKVADEILRQTDLGENRGALIRGLDLQGVKSYTLTLKARKLGGNEGFIVMLDAFRDGRHLWWNIGGWNNTQHAFERDGQTVGRPMAGSVESNRWYDIKIEREGNRTRGYLDGKLVQELEETSLPSFAAVAGIDRKAGELVIKVVNGAEVARTTTLQIDGARLANTGRATVLTGPAMAAENSFDNPKRIFPKRLKMSDVSGRMTYTFEPRSLTVLRLPIRR